MSKQAIKLKASSREQKGKACARRMRRLDNAVPAVVYGLGKEAQMIALDHNVLLKYLGQEAFHTQVIELDVEGQEEQVVLKDAQFYPGKSKVLHADFLRVSATEKLTMKIPLHFKGEETAPGVKLEGGVVSRNLSEVEIRCLPSDLPESISLDLSTMVLNQVLHLSDIVMPPGVELVALVHGEEDHNLPVVSIHPPSQSEEVDAVQEPASGGVEEGAEKSGDKAEGNSSTGNDG